MSPHTTVLPRSPSAEQTLGGPVICAPLASLRDDPAASRFSRIGRLFLALPKFWWMALDAACVIVGLYVGYWFFRLSDWGNWDQVHLWQAAAVLCPIVMLAGLLFGLHEQETLANRSWIVGRVLLTICISVLISYAIISSVLYDIWSRRVAAIALACYALLGISFRWFAAQAIRAFHPALLFVGEKPDSPYMRALLADPRMKGYGRLHHLNRLEGGFSDPAGTCDWNALCRANDIREIVIHSDEFRNSDVLVAAFDALRTGRRVTDAVTFFEKTLHRVPVDLISPEWFLFADLQLYRHEQATLKRIFDLMVAAAGLLVSLVLTPVVALAIKLDSRGPVFYCQDRVGLNGKVFRLYKFRTMTTDAEGAGVLWSYRGDQRVTRVGRFLRRTRLDELPQFMNILRGQMSVVGPRPERPPFVAQLSEAIPFYSQRHLIKPGLTGWAQINYRYGSCAEDAKRKLEYDLYYMKHMSLELDLVILLRTVLTVLRDHH